MYFIPNLHISIFYVIYFIINNQVGQQDRTASCKLCGVGKANAQLGQTAIGACLDCGKGRYGIQAAQAACKACVAGRYRDKLAGKWVILYVKLYIKMVYVVACLCVVFFYRTLYILLPRLIHSLRC